MSVGPVLEVSATGKDIEQMIERILPTVAGESLPVVSAAMLMIIMRSMKEDISAEQLVEGAQGASQWLALYLSSLEDMGRPN